MDLYIKQPENIKRRIENWFLKYFREDITAFTGNELFTLFDLLVENHKNEIIDKLDLRDWELPVLMLKISVDEAIINTTERFIRLSTAGIESIEYIDFDCHDGYKSIAIKVPNEKALSVKTDGYNQEFGLKKINGEIIYWNIPTGSPGFAFWNVTKTCGLIVR